ncbi:hypothetical protein G6F46_005395 [Rhizopus delemar]|uniref:Uncharacterized protein n=2 Tax=Rhizopus TaxID=4842 RepID=A0A9P6YYG6_9FUNG|nr:hypothetical protein G6F55_007947 [Rhizopus delemar]KAG1539318.1 hypothetical protein G6F51_009208 [Rhizopus arrhizus]KAG1493535.1 hypothetical protein G6F54_008506 [Rhizopus delemar]KAG1507585.1 hypothetical protein G6F53_008833 [Rhizopus delemar]KAG1522999.1 hypothetical protein G6F52_005378 [Rhizopus delemar]
MSQESTPIAKKDKSTNEKFDEVTDKWVKLTVKTFNLKSVKEAFRPILPKEGMEELENAHIQAQDFIDTELRNKLQEIKEKYQLNEKMQHLDNLMKEAKDRPPIEKRVLPTPEQIARSMIYESKEKERTRLQEEFNTLKAENDLLLQQLIEKKRELRGEIEIINETLEDTEKTFDIAFTLPLNDMTELSYRIDTTKV